LDPAREKRVRNAGVFIAWTPLHRVVRPALVRNYLVGLKSVKELRLLRKMISLGDYAEVYPVRAVSVLKSLAGNSRAFEANPRKI
jgi:hypothetical protein